MGQAKPLRLLTYNIYLGGTGRLEAIYEVIAHAQADIITLNEADDPVLVAALAERSAMHHVWAEGSGRRHIATLSRFPIIEWRIYKTRPLTQAALETRLEAPGQPFTLYNVHLLPYPLLPLEIRRWQALGKLLAIIRQRQPGPHLIAGDFNAIAPGDPVLPRHDPAWAYRLMFLQGRRIFRLALTRLPQAGYTDCFRSLNPQTAGFTWTTDQLTSRNDYIWADAYWAARLHACWVVDDLAAVYKASDHLPVLAEFGSPIP